MADAVALVKAAKLLAEQRRRAGKVPSTEVVPGAPVETQPEPDSVRVLRELQGDPQREANTFEKLLDFLAIPSQASAGVARSLVTGENVVDSVRDAVENNYNYGKLLRENTDLPDWATGTLGFAGDVLLDPTTYIGIGGLSKAGKAAEAAEAGYKLAKMSGDLAKVAEARTALGRAGRLGRTAGERVLRGQEGLLKLDVPFTKVNKALSDLPGLRGLKGAEARVAGALESAGGAVANLAPVKAAASGFRQAFKVAPELSGIDRDVFLAKKAEHDAVQRLADKKTMEELKPVADEVEKVAQAHGLDGRALDRAMADAIERSGVRASNAQVASAIANATAVFGAGAQNDLALPLRKLVAAINIRNAKNLKATRAAGIALDELNGPLNYLYHAITPEGRKLIEAYNPDEFGGLGRQITERHRNQLARSPELAGKTITEVNDLAEAGKLALTGYQPVPGGLFIENPFVAQTLRNREAADAISSAQFLRGYANAYGRFSVEQLTKLRDALMRSREVDAPLRLKEIERRLWVAQNVAGKAAPKGWKAVSNEIKGLEGIAFPKDIADALGSHREGLTNPGPFIAAWDRVQSAWKKYALGIYPVYHTRNEIGDLWNAVVLGKMNPARMVDAMRASIHGTALWRGGAEPAFNLGGKRYTATEVKALAEKLGVTDSGIVGEMADALGSLRRTPRSAIERVANALDDNVATQLGMKVGTARENVTRLAMFMDGLREGLPPHMAAVRTKKYLFDYAQLTHFERNYLRRFWAPFYAFTRYNAPLQIQHLIAAPGRFAMLEKLRGEVAGDEPLGLERSPLPGYLAESYPLRAGKTPEGNPQFLRMEGLVPGFDAELAVDPQAAFKRAVDLTNPFITTPLQMGANVDLFRSDVPRGQFEKLEEYPGERENFLGLPLSSRWAVPPLAMWRPIAELNRANPFGVFGSREQGPSWLPEDVGIPRRGADLSAGTRAGNLLYGRAFGVDEAAQESRSQYLIEREVSRLENLRDQFLSRGDVANAEAVQNHIDRLRSGEEQLIQ